MNKSIHAALIAAILVLVSTSSATAQSNAPYYDVIGDITVAGDVTKGSLSDNDPWTMEIPVPPIEAAMLPGFYTGFYINASVNESPVILDSFRVTQCTFDLLHLDVLTGVETPVLRPGGTVTNIPISLYTNEFVTPQGNHTRPSAFTTGTVNFTGSFNSVVNTPIVGTTVSNVARFWVTKHLFTWNNVPDFTRPVLNQGYVVRWTIKFIPTYQGVQYPEATVRPTFKYKVMDIPLPEFVGIGEYDDGAEGPGLGKGTIVRMSGPYLEFFELQRSTDLQSWSSVPAYGEGANWVGSNTYTFENGWVGPNIFEWTLFDPSAPDIRRRLPREFYRMVWTGKRASWRPQSPPSST